MAGDSVTFKGTKVMGALGIVGGVTIAAAVPYVVLRYAADAGLGSFPVTLICVLALIAGVALAGLATFFAIVIPTKAGN